MGESKQIYEDVGFKKNDKNESPHISWTVMEGGNDSCESESMESSSSDWGEDASSSPSSWPSHGPLYELSDLMTYLPIKKGLSKHYQGKSQSFASLASVMNLEELAKKEIYYSKRLKSCKSYGGILDGRKYGPKATIAKKEVFKRHFN
ncbi:uncharacterized protein Fot_08839 [Forsythia ovata]|uniref:Uncharacterized protein n=1 Tax=Forsythia ovata TaxID=205694 RepID=A0ABD1X0K6_9LAMI